MLERIKWLTIMIAIATLLMGAQTVIGRVIHSPAVFVDPTSNPTLIPSRTTAPITTTSPKKAATLLPGVSISEIVYDPPEGGLAGEYAVVENTLNSPVDLAGWTLRDDQKNVYTFPSYLLDSGKTVKVWTRTGVDTSGNLYWNYNAELWNIGGDCGYLRDENAALQSHICY